MMEETKIIGRYHTVTKSERRERENFEEVCLGPSVFPSAAVKSYEEKHDQKGNEFPKSFT